MPGSPLNAVIHTISRTIVLWRRLHYKLTDEDFAETYLNLPADERATFERLINEGRVEAALKQINKTDSPDSESVKTLREQARKLGIKYYSVMLKHELLHALAEHEQLRLNQEYLKRLQSEEAPTQELPGDNSHDHAERA